MSETIRGIYRNKEKGVVDFDPTHFGKPIPPIEPIKIKGGPISDTIIEDRGSR